MAETAYTKALTTKARIKSLLTISVTTFDTVLDRLINSATDHIESVTSRKFLSATYTNEVYSVHTDNYDYLMLKNAPVSALTTLEYSAGTPSNKNWTEYNDDDFELGEDGKSGLVRVYGGLVKGTNTVRATYTAGYLINWANAGDQSTHTLPADLTALCERMVIRMFKRREAEGKSSESFDGASVTWDTKLTEEDKAVINKYTRLPVFI